jgi:hypothetical protein
MAINRKPRSSKKKLNASKKRKNTPKNEIKKRKKQKSKKTTNNQISTKGVKSDPFNWSKYNFWDMMFQPHFIKHDYMDKNKYVYARLVIYKKPQEDVRGFINFLIDGHITLNRLDRTDDESVHRMTVGIDDKIMFLVDKTNSNFATFIDYIPKYQQEIKQNKTGLHNPKQEFGVVSGDRIRDVRDIFSWLQHTAKPEYLKEILTRVEITKGIKMKDKEEFKFSGKNDKLSKKLEMNNDLK